MQSYFFELSDLLCASLKGGEVLLLTFSGEDSDFIRFNQSRVRQAGSVTQAGLGMELIEGRRHVKSAMSLCHDLETDTARLQGGLAQLRSQLPHVPEDPYLLYAEGVQSGVHEGVDALPDPEHALDQILKAGRGRDMVGIHAQGGILSGFASSLGQRNWFATHSFNLSWSFYHAADKAVKTRYAGFAWSEEAFLRKAAEAGEQLAVLARPPKTIAPGSYRVYLAPSALESFVEMLCYDGFSLKAHRSKTTPLLRMVQEEARLSPEVTFCENTREGIAPNFQSQGFIRPDRVTLVEQGRCRDALVSPRSGKEFDVEPNGASAAERPESLDMAAGAIPRSQVLERLDSGVYINQAWYLNFSDRPACRITGMTRFATLWVEHGEIVAPMNVMRFDETIYHALGDRLIGLTAERDFLPSDSTYGGRSTGSVRLPGALIEDFTFTL